MSRAKNNTIAKNWCFTCYSLPISQLDKVNYLVYQKENCPTTGRQHYQGYVQMKNRCRRTGVQAILGILNCHVELARGTPAENTAYCTKERTRVPGTDPFVFGSPINERSRTDIQRFVQAVQEGCSDLNLAINFPSAYSRMQRVMNTIRDHQRGKNFIQKTVFVLYGQPGSGKTRLAHEIAGDDLYMVPPAAKYAWFDGYAGETHILFDDFDGQMDFRTLLQVLDGYAMRVAIKGGFVLLTSPVVWITSNTHPKKWYPDQEEWNFSPLKRRISFILLLHKASESLPLEFVRMVMKLPKSVSVDSV